MRFLRTRINQVEHLLQAYGYPQPMDMFLRGYFRQHRSMGGKDRRAIRELTYAYLRWGKAWSEYTTSQGILLSAASLSSAATWNPLAIEHGLGHLLPEDWESRTSIERIEWLVQQYAASETALYPAGELSPERTHLNAWKQLLFRPAVWLHRLRESPKDTEQLKPHKELPHALLVLDGAWEERPGLQVQDLASQFLLSHVQVKPGEQVWDCCCGAGGKSLAISLEPVELYLSDLRRAMLETAIRRIGRQKGDIRHSAVLDLRKDPVPANWPRFDHIIADVPCSGSGTWFRHPEHFRYFDPAEIAHYVELQRQIITAVLPHLKENGILYYMTCSVFTRENEEQLRYFQEHLGLKLQGVHAYDGTKMQSDSMFIALLVKG